MATKLVTSILFKKNIPETDLNKYTYLIHGARKIGKTCFASEFKNPVFLMFEHNYKALPINYAYMESWVTFKTAVSSLKSNCPYDTIVIDTGGGAYQYCYNWILSELGVEEMPEDRGVTWAVIRNEFEKVNNELFALGKGIIVLAHSQEVTTKRHGIEETKIRVDLSKQANSYYPGAVNVIGYFHYDIDGSRILTIAGDDGLDAGSQVVGKFKYPDGTPIIDIPMGKNQKEGYRNFELAFNNKLLKPKVNKTTYSISKEKK